MTSTNTGLQTSIARQREILSENLRAPMRELARACAKAWGDRERLDRALIEKLHLFPYGEYLYALDPDAVQVSDNITHTDVIEADFGRNRSQRPYILGLSAEEDFLLSSAYISLRMKRPSLTAIQVVRDAEGKQLGYVGADFDLRNLPLTGRHYEEPKSWRQIKGDPAIRGLVFHQTRSDSRLDINIEEVIGVLEELIEQHGVFQMVVHFSSSRATIWTTNDPFRYRLLDIEALTDPDVCFAFPHLPYARDAAIPAGEIRAILENVKKLRYMDDMFYLRSCSMNIFNGIISLTFSCDGSHYLPYQEFLEKDIDFWVGTNN